MMVRPVSCGVGECRRAVIDRSRQREREREIRTRRRKNNSITEHVQEVALVLTGAVQGYLPASAQL
jgi:hypothetical protein